ncbi:MAG: VanZ family protein [Cellvibrio sp.]|uniref:VanZ family protein n=1 Tax=Cellvibrio sp. TaxID=1965322 RepID=UPI002715FF73|nr:VanZ family protein [Cellvibrio sp.]
MNYRVSHALTRLPLMAELTLLVGTQMPLAWRAGAVQVLHAPSWVSFFGHLALFAGMAIRPLVSPVARIVLGALALALLTEGLQLLAIDRHPRWLDVCIDMAGALAGVGLIKLGFLCFVRR